MDFKGTRGKWKYCYDGFEYCYDIVSDNGFICTIMSGNTKAKADALIISKSPLLLKAIKDSINELREVGLNDMANYHEKLYNECVNL